MVHCAHKEGDSPAALLYPHVSFHSEDDSGHEDNTLTPT